jgi:hypothetical protein
MVFWLGIIPVVVLVHRAVELEQWAMANPWSYGTVAAVLAAAAAAARWHANRTARQDGPDLQFEETPSDAVIALGLEP